MFVIPVGSFSSETLVNNPPPDTSDPPSDSIDNFEAELFGNIEDFNYAMFGYTD